MRESVQRQQNELLNNFKKKDLKLKLANTIYVCECEKNFLSFPAIYSHARNKHNVKLTSKVKSGGFTRSFDGKQEKVYFKFSQNQAKNQKLKIECNSINREKNIINDTTNFKFISKINKIYNNRGEVNIYGAASKYLEYCSVSPSTRSLLEISDTFLLFTECINSHYMIFDQTEVHQSYCQDMHPRMIPYFLNFFLIWYLPSNLHRGIHVSKDLDHSVICEILGHFCRWLKVFGYIHVDCTINEEFLSAEKDTYSNQLKNFIKIE